MITHERLFPLSHSALSKFEQSPLHYLYSREHKEQTPAMIFGSAYHCKLLQPDLFPDKYVVQPKYDLRTTAGKEQYAIFLKENPDKVFISHTDIEKLDAMLTAINKCKPAKELIDRIGEAEKRIEWIDELTLARLVGIIDGEGDDFVLDFKTCADATPRLFNSSIFNYGYHRQAAMYLDGLKSKKKKSGKKKFFFIAQEKDEPYGASVHLMSPEALEIGRTAYNGLILNFLKWAQQMQDVGYEHWSETGHYEVTIPKWMRYGN